MSWTSGKGGTSDSFRRGSAGIPFGGVSIYVEVFQCFDGRRKYFDFIGSGGRSWPSVAPADTVGQADLSTFPVWPTCSMWSAMVGPSNSLLKLKSMLGYASGRHSFQSIQFTEYCFPSHWIFLGCEPPIGIGVIAENVPA